MIVEKTKFKYSSCCLLAKHVGWRKYERIGSKHMEYANKQLCGQALKSDIISMAFQNDVLHKHSQDFGVITFFQLNHCFFFAGVVVRQWYQSLIYAFRSFLKSSMY